MAKEKKSRKNRAMKVWGAVTALVLVVTVTANILCTSVFNGFLDIFFGGVRPEYDREIVSMYPAAEAQSKEDALANAQAWYVIAFCIVTVIVNSVNCIWIAVAGKFVPDWIYNIGTTVLNGGVSMVIFFVVNKIIFPEGEAKKVET